MTESMFESMAERLNTDISKEIAYTYAVFVPNDTESVISEMKSTILLKDSKFFGQDLLDSFGNRLKFPADVLNSNLEKHITNFYDELRISTKTARDLAAYGERGKEFEKRFDESLNQSKKSLISLVKYEMYLQMMQDNDTKSVIEHIQKILTRRLSSLRVFLEDTAGQLGQYMILWDYQDKGCTHYRLKTNGDNCKECNALDGKVFRIDEAIPGENLMPLHPNCDCSVEVLDANNNVVFPTEEEKPENEKDTGTMDYLQASLRQIVLGNYTDDVNLVGTLGQVALGLAGLDLPGDVRDILYDITNFEVTPGHMLQTLLDILAVVPVVGVVKYTDEAIDLAKSAGKYGDEAADALKSATKYVDEAVEGGKISKRRLLLEKTTNQKLKNAIREMYRENAKIGDGGLSDAIRYELRTGELVSGKSHLQKGRERLKNLENILEKQDLNSMDKETAINLIEDLKKALEGK